MNGAPCEPKRDVTKPNDVGGVELSRRKSFFIAQEGDSIIPQIGWNRGVVCLGGRSRISGGAKRRRRILRESLKGYVRQ